MADNLTLNAGSGGSTLATDDITDAGGAHYQRVKLTDGTANSETHVHTGNGTSTNALRVTVSSDSTGVLSVDDNGGNLSIDLNGTNPSLNTGVVDAGTQRVTLATDVALPAGTNAIGKLAANSGVDIGDVDVTSLDGVAAEGAALGNGILIQGDDGTDRKNINVDPTTGDVQVDVTNTVTVDGSGVTQPVSGTVTANLSATDNAVLDDIAAKLAPNATNGVTPYLNQDTSAIDTVKSGAGTVYWITCMSIDATPVYLNLYDSTTAVLGTTTPTNQFIVPTQGDANGAGFTMNFGPLGIQYSTGIQVAAATTFNGSTDPGTNVVITNIGYE